MKQTSRASSPNQPPNSRPSSSIPPKGGCKGGLLLLFLLSLFFSCRPLHYSERRAQLDSLQRTNQADTVFRSDSLQRILVDYFDRHGTADDRMLAHYLLGRACSDMGETPRALEAYQSAASCADTTSRGAFALLNRIHQNAGLLFFREYLPELALKEWQLARRYAIADGDNYGEVLCECHTIRAYFQLGMDDSVVNIAKRCYSRFLELGKKKEAVQVSSTLFHHYLNDGELEQSRKILEAIRVHIDFKTDTYERVGGYWNSYGKLLLGLEKADSAILCFRNVLEVDSTWLMGKVLGYHGLYLSYRQLGVPDSTFKYAELYNAANDSSNIFRSSEQVARMHAMYNYEHSERKAVLATAKADSLKKDIIILCLVFAFINLAGIHMYFSRRREKQAEMLHLSSMYGDLLQKYNINLQELNLLRDDNSRQKNLIELKEAENASLQHEIAKIQDDQLPPDKWNLPVEVLSSPILREIRKKASKGMSATDDDIKMLMAFVNHHFPSFITRVEETYPRISQQQELICLFAKLRFIPSEVASLLGCTLQTLSNRRRRLCAQMFGNEANTGDFDLLVRKL